MSDREDLAAVCDDGAQFRPVRTLDQAASAASGVGWCLFRSILFVAGSTIPDGLEVWNRSLDPADNRCQNGENQGQNQCTKTVISTN